MSETNTGRLIFIDKEKEKSMSKDEKDFVKDLMERKSRELEQLCVIYHPSCGCTVDQFVVLDRFPMSPKIIGTCPACDKYCHMEISEPIRFHLPLHDKDYGLEELKSMIVTNSPQKNLIESYQNI
jgi:hypothetical protein